MKRFVIILILFVSLKFVLADTAINEVMYNPEGSDNNKEFIEIFSDNYINLTGYIIEDSYSTDTLQLLNYYNSQYSLIVEEGFDYNGINASVYSVGATIGNNLNNDEDLIIIKNSNNTVLDVLHYYSEWGASNNGNSLCKINNVWQECSPTAGLSNSFSDQNEDSCDWTILIILNRTVFEDPEFQVKLLKLTGEGKANLTVDKWIEDSKGNIVKTYSSWNAENVLNYKTSSKYSPSLAKGDAYFIKAKIVDISCDDTNVSNDFIYEMIFISDEQLSTNSNSSMNITKISPNSAEFGDIVKAEINVYRGDTAKYAVYAYVENDEDRVSEKVTMHFKDKFTNYFLTVPIQLKPDCDERYDDGKYNVVLEGLDLKTTSEFEIEGINNDLCEEASNEDDFVTSSRKSYGYELISSPYEAEIGNEIITKVRLINEGDESLSFDVYSYIYRGSKSYSGEREENLKTVLVRAGKSIDDELINEVLDADPGDYKLKIRIKPEHLIHPKEITRDISLTSPAKESQNQVTGNPITLFRTRDPKIVYESTSYKARNKVTYFLISSLALLTLILLWRK
jgi:hypothetical protein